MQYKGTGGACGIIIRGGVKSGKRNRHKDPVLIGIAAGNEDNDDGYEEEQQE
jgi:hypothetical protein